MQEGDRGERFNCVGNDQQCMYDQQWYCEEIKRIVICLLFFLKYLGIVFIIMFFLY